MERWLFQGNPARWRIFEYLRDHPEEDWQDFGWSAVRYLDRIAPGDAAVLWLSGPPAARGVYGIGEVIGSPEPAARGSRYWSSAADRDKVRMSVRLRLTHVLFGEPILARDLKADPRFAEASILRVPRGGNPHALTRPELDAIRSQVR